MNYDELNNLPSNTCQKTSEDVMFYDTDIGGVIHNLAYLRFIEKNRTLFAEKLGMNLKKLANDNLYPVVTNINISYKKPASLGDKILTIGKISEISRVKFTCEFYVFNEISKNLLVHSTQKLAMIKYPPGKPVKLPEKFIDKINSFNTNI